MLPWTLIERVPTVDGKGVMSLHRRGDEYSIRIDGRELMNSRRHGSEEAMGRLVCESLAGVGRPRVMVAGLGMGFTVAAANRHLPPGAAIEVVELMQAVLGWNHGLLGALANHPLSDERVQTIHGDVRVVLARARNHYDAILLDVDNGPEAITQAGNQWLYGRAGLARIAAALQPKGILGVWSARPDERFSRRLRTAGFDASTHLVPAHDTSRGPKHTIWLATIRATVASPREAWDRRRDGGREPARRRRLT